jgi:two-component system response regulator FixJ
VDSGSKIEGAGALVVHIVDDESAVRETLVSHVESLGQPTASHSTAEGFLESADLGLAGCVVTDVRMPGMGGIALLHRLRETASDLPVILITAHGDVPMAVEALKAGAADFLEKPFPAQSLRDAIGRAVDVRRRQLGRESERHAALARIDSLTGREAEVMSLIIEGHSNAEAARALGISIRTVENHRARIMDKTETRNLTELVRLAYFVGLVSPP